MSLYTLMTFGIALAALVALMLMRVSMRQLIIERHVARIDRMLETWAKGWGEPPDKLRAELLAILTEETRADVGSPMGADLGVSVVCAVLARSFFR